MSKIKRNDPCPCGSGKKYKNCCGANKVIGIDPNLINMKLNQLHQQLVTFAFDNYEEQINEQVSLYTQPLLEDNQELADIYNTGLSIWIILNVPCLSQNKTIFDAFSEKHLMKIEYGVRTSFKKWDDAVPSVYEVVSNESSANSVIVKEILSEETYEVPINKGDNISKGTLLVGALIPFMRFHNFFYTFIKLFNRNTQEVYPLLKQYTELDGGLKKHFPNLLADALFQGVVDLDEDQQAYGKVSQLFANHMIDKNIHEDIISEGVSLWKRYFDQEKPSIKKVEAYAAALEYYVQKNILNNSSLTQSGIAEDYSVSPGTVSSNYRKLNDVLGK